MKSRNARLSKQQEAELDALRNMTDEEIDFSDAPETLDWSKGRRGEFYEPTKRKVAVVLDQYVIEWFKNNTPNGQDCGDAMNQALLDHIQRVRFIEGSES